MDEDEASGLFMHICTCLHAEEENTTQGSTVNEVVPEASMNTVVSETFSNTVRNAGM